MTIRQTLSLLPALCALAALCGCASAPAPQAPLETTKFTVENTDRFVALDPAAEAAVSCTGLQERTLGDGRLEIVANLRNSDVAKVRVRVQCVFVDDQGVQVGADAPWQALEIPGNSTEVMRFTASATTARRYVIRVRTAR